MPKVGASHWNISGYGEQGVRTIVICHSTP